MQAHGQWQLCQLPCAMLGVCAGHGKPAKLRWPWTRVPPRCRRLGAAYRPAKPLVVTAAACAQAGCVFGSSLNKACRTCKRTMAAALGIGPSAGQAVALYRRGDKYQSGATASKSHSGWTQSSLQGSCYDPIVSPYEPRPVALSETWSAHASR